MRPPWSHALVRRGAPAKSARNLLFDKMDPPPDTLPPDDHDGDEQQADPKLPVTRREVGEIILQQPVDQSADEAAIEIAGAADDEDQQHVGRALDRKHGERREGWPSGGSGPSRAAPESSWQSRGRPPGARRKRGRWRARR